MAANSRRGNGSKNLNAHIFKIKQAAEKGNGKECEAMYSQSPPSHLCVSSSGAAPPKPPYIAPSTGDRVLTYLSPARTVLIQTTMVFFLKAVE